MMNPANHPPPGAYGLVEVAGRPIPLLVPFYRPATPAERKILLETTLGESRTVELVPPVGFALPFGLAPVSWWRRLVARVFGS